MDNNEIISILIKRTSLEFDKLANRFLTEYNLTHTQFKILRYLMEQPNLTITQRKLETYFSMTNPSITGILQNLEKKQLILREVNPDDARSKVIGLTDKSADMEAELSQLSQKMDYEFTSPLSDDEKDQLANLLQKILAN